MVNYHEGPAFDVSSENSKHAFIPLATTTIRRSRVRQRLSFAQRPTQVIMTSLPPASTSLRDRKQQHQQRPNDNHSNTLEISIDSGRRIFNNSAVHASRVSGGSGSMDNHYQVPKTQKRIKDAGNCRRWTDVLSILDSWEGHARRLDAKTYNIAIAALSKCGRWREAFATLDRMRSKGVPPDTYSFNSAISACGRARRWQEALSVLAEMEKESSGVRPDLFSYNGAINAVAKSGRWMLALDILKSIEVKGLTPDVISYTSCISACDLAGEWQQALDTLDLMLKRNVVPNIITFGTAMSACARKGRWQKALFLLEEVERMGLEPNAHVYSSAVHACVVGGEPRRALVLVEEMIERGVVPDVVAFTSAMKAVDGWAAALRLLAVMKREGVLPDVAAYNAALSVVSRSGREDMALALLDQMRTDGCSPDVISFNTVIDACVLREKWQEAVQLLEVDMPGAKVRPDVITFTSVIHACAGPEGNWEKAYQIFDSMWQDSDGVKPNKLTYDLTIQACGHGGEWELGVSLVDDMGDMGTKPDCQTFNIAIAACARSGQRLAAEMLVAKMWKLGVTPDRFTYASVVAACSRAGEWKRATEVFDEARYVRRISPSLEMYGALLFSLAAAKRWADVLTYFDRMVADGIAPDEAASKTGALAAAELGDGRRAVSILEGEQRQVVGNGGDEHDDQRSVAGSAKENGAEADAVPEPVLLDGAALGPAHLEASSGDFGTQEVNASEKRSAGGWASWDAVSPSLLNSVLHALDSQRDDTAVLKAIKRGRENGVLLNSTTYKCAMKACGNLEDHFQASTLLAQMAEENIKPGIIHWNHALRASAASARWREARSRLREMQASGIAPDKFSYSMALTACSAGLWSGDLWSSEDGWGPEEENTSAGSRRSSEETPQNEEEQGGNLAACRGMHAIELLRQMSKSGIQLSGWSFTLAMAACLESYRDRHVATGRKGPPEADLRLAQAVLSLFDRMVSIGEMPTGYTYALALKACARTANTHRAFSLFSTVLDAPAMHAAEAQQTPLLEVRPWHLTSAIAAFDAAGDWTGVQELWEEASRRGVSPHGSGYSAAISAAIRAGEMAAASKLEKDARWLNLDLGIKTTRLLAQASQM